MMGEATTYGHLFEIDIDDVLREKFANGQGVIQLQPDMTDDMLLAIIKHAASLSTGKPFLVMPPAA